MHYETPRLVVVVVSARVTTKAVRLAGWHEVGWLVRVVGWYPCCFVVALGFILLCHRFCTVVLCYVAAVAWRHILMFGCIPVLRHQMKFNLEYTHKDLSAELMNKTHM